MEDSCQIPGKGAGEKDSQFQDRHNNPHNFTVPVEQNTQAMVTGDSSQRRLQNRSNIEVIRDDYVIGDCNMGHGGHNVEAASSSQGGMVGAGDSARIPATNLGNLQNEEEMEIQHREGKHHVQALRQSRTSHMDEQLIKNQSKNTSIPHIDKSHTPVISASQIHVTASNEQRRKENEQIWVAKKQKKNQQQVYQENFPRISTNFDKSVHKVNATNVRYDRPTGNIPNLLKTDPLAAPAPYTIVQTYADRLRYNQAKCDESSPSLEVLDKYKGIKDDSRPQTAATQGQVQDEYNRKSANTGQDNINRLVQKDKSSTQVAVGGLDGKGQETPNNLQEGVSKGRGELTHARHEDVDSDPSGDSRAPATPINNQQQTVTQQVVNKGNKGKKVKVTPDDYGVLNSEDDLDPDNQYMDDSDEDAEDTMTHTDQVVGSTFRDKYSDVQRMTEQHGLCPRGRKQTRHQPNHPVTSMSDNSSRHMTRSKSKGF
uniref:Bifunctional endo-1,4-beta-xylanase xylA n=1 Tax=Solanum tuberosum TaxID=4113 RepID=M1DTX0_SOLTU